MLRYQLVGRILVLVPVGQKGIEIVSVTPPMATNGSQPTAVVRIPGAIIPLKGTNPVS